MKPDSHPKQRSAPCPFCKGCPCGYARSIDADALKLAREELEILARTIGHPNPDKREQKDCDLRARATKALRALGA